MSPGSTQLVPSRALEIDGRPLRVFDGHLPQVARYVQELSLALFARTEIARPETAAYRHWVKEMKLETVPRPIFELTQRAVLGFVTPQFGYRAHRAYTNFAGFGDMLFTHVDCTPEEHDLTALWYLCDEWDLEWGGETVFFDVHDEIACAIRPRPGRLIVFDGAIKHAGRPPNRICFAPRYTFAMKFERIPASA
ncbi:MAG: 2OG-Fe(II) oxygenase [Rhodanobacteraceae bacterium]